MAALAKGKRQGTWKAYYYDAKIGKQVWVPAAITRVWDDLPEAEAQERLEAWLADSGLSRVRSKRRSLLKGSNLDQLLVGYADYMRSMRAGRAVTLRDEESRLRGYAVGYFVQHHGQSDVTKWWRFTASYGTYLRSTYPNLDPNSVKKLCQSVRRFGEYLAAHNHIAQPWLVPVPKIKKERTTPLARALSPDEVLSLAKKVPDRWALFLLITYFASLRPEETYALEIGDFVTGERAKKEAKTHARLGKHGLGSGLSISISRTHTGKDPVALTKTHYATGVVQVWSSSAAVRIGALLKELKTARLFEGTRNQLNTAYKSEVLPKLNLKAGDLRRASCLYLGREVGLDPILLQEHMRHSVITTTMLYTRRPAEEREAPDQQNFDDVG